MTCGEEIFFSGAQTVGCASHMPMEQMIFVFLVQNAEPEITNELVVLPKPTSDFDRLKFNLS